VELTDKPRAPARVSHGTKWDKISENALCGKEKSEICHISVTFPINVANQIFNLAGALKLLQ
jgi:hypothetical protein